MDLKFDAEFMSQVVSKAILDGISQDQRDALLAAAVEALVTPKRTTYGMTPKTPIQEAFESAAEIACRQIAHETLTQDARFMDRVRELTREAIERALSAEGGEELRRKILAAITDSAAASW